VLIPEYILRCEALKMYQNSLDKTINQNISEWELETPKEIRANAVDDAVKA
jgi:hypothetical protein